MQASKVVPLRKMATNYSFELASYDRPTLAYSISYLLVLEHKIRSKA